MATLTANYSLEKPTPDGDEDTWGEMLNRSLDKVDTELFDRVRKTGGGSPQTMINRLAVPECPLSPAGAAEMENNRVANVSWVEYRIKALLNQFLPVGTIIMWAGSYNNIPAGWAQCDGLGGFPDLRGRIILCAHPTISGVLPGQGAGTPSSAPFSHIHYTGPSGATPGGEPMVQGYAGNNANWGGNAATPPYAAVTFIGKKTDWV